MAANLAASLVVFAGVVLLDMACGIDWLHVLTGTFSTLSYCCAVVS